MENATLDAVAPAIATELGEGWTLRPKGEEEDSSHRDSYIGRYLDGPDGMEVWVRVDWRNKSRLVASGSLNPREPGVSTYGMRPWDKRDIGVSIERGAKVIAREIARRLLPPYQEDLTEWRKRVAQHNAYEAAKATTGQRIAEALGTVPNRDGDIGWYPKGSGYGSFKPYNDTCRIEVSVPADVAVQIAALLRAECGP